MQKAKNVKEFVERIDQAKKLNPKDLSSDQDLTICIMNLISIEEHLAFSGAKTEKTSYYDLIENVRELRKNLMLKIIPQYEGEVWCISKHLLSSSMRLMEVGTKQLNIGNKEEAYKLFDQSYELYCLFWGLNMNIVNLEDIKWVDDDINKIQDISKKIDDNSFVTTQTVDQVKEDENGHNDKKIFSKLKSTIKKMINCCIE